MERDGRHRLRGIAWLVAIGSAAAALGAAIVMVPLRLLGLRRQPEPHADPAGVIEQREQSAVVAVVLKRDGEPADVSTSEQQAESGVHLPSPTYWPAVFGFGLGMIMFGLVTYHAFTLLGVLLIIAALIGWIGDLLHG